MDERWPRYPAITSEHVRNARLFANRHDQIAGLPIAKGGRVAEVGVWRAAFSKVLVDLLKPSQFVAFDIFTGHLETNWNGMTGHQLFDGLTHRQFYEREMAPFAANVTIVEGDSRQTLRPYADRSFDLVYVDGNHYHEFVKSDAELGAEMVKDAGFLVFNDYMLIDHNHANYGIVPVVNDMVVNHGWQVAGFALDQHLYCDIALQRRTATASAEPPVITSRPSLLKRLFGG